MGFYIEGPVTGKADWLLENHDAIELKGPKEAEKAFNEGYGIICVIDNGAFDAAGFMFSLLELKAFSDPFDPRFRRWLAMDRKTAEELCGFKQ